MVDRKSSMFGANLRCPYDMRTNTTPENEHVGSCGWTPFIQHRPSSPSVSSRDERLLGKSSRLEYSRVPSSNLAVASEATSGEK